MMRLLSSSRASDWKLSAEVEVLDYRQRQHYDGERAQLNHNEMHPSRWLWRQFARIRLELRIRIRQSRQKITRSSLLLYVHLSRGACAPREPAGIVEYGAMVFWQG